MGAYFFPPAPGVVRIYFVWEVRPYWAAFGLSHTNCMGFSAIRFVWPNICIFPKVDRGRPTKAYLSQTECIYRLDIFGGRTNRIR